MGLFDAIKFSFKNLLTKTDNYIHNYQGVKSFIAVDVIPVGSKNKTGFKAIIPHCLLSDFSFTAYAAVAGKFVSTANPRRYTYVDNEDNFNSWPKMDMYVKLEEYVRSALNTKVTRAVWYSAKNINKSCELGIFEYSPREASNIEINSIEKKEFKKYQDFFINQGIDVLQNILNNYDVYPQIGLDNVFDLKQDLCIYKMGENGLEFEKYLSLTREATAQITFDYPREIFKNRFFAFNNNCLMDECFLLNYEGDCRRASGLEMFQMHYSHSEFIFLDFETSGLDFKNDKIIQAGIIKTDNNFNVIEKVNLYIKYDGLALSNDTTNLTGITTELLHEQGVTEQDFVAKLLKEVFNDKTNLVFAYNAHFDLSFIYELLKKYGKENKFVNNDYLDLMTVFKTRADYPHKLKDAINYYDLNGVQNSHSALDDALALPPLLVAMINEDRSTYSYINAFGYNPKYTISGTKLPKIIYFAQK